MKTLVASLFLFFFLLTVSAQQSVVLSGRIYDKSTNEPMPYTTISIPKTGTGVISNEYGEFVYHLPDNNENESVQVSFIGYETIYFPVDSIKTGIIYTIEMQPKFIEISEIDVVAEKLITPEILINQAIRRITKNYSRKNFQLHGYYRDYIRDVNTNNYNNLTEAAVIIEDKGYNTNDYYKTKIKIEQIRYNPQIATDTSLNIAYDGTVKYVPNVDISSSNDLALLLMHNPIRNHNIKTFSFVDYFDDTFMDNHEFQIKSFIRNDSTEIYEIQFVTEIYTGAMPDTEYQGEGIIHINSEDMAILKFNYKVSCVTPSYIGKLLELRLEFKEFSKKYYLSYISMDNYFEFSYKNNEMSSQKVDHLFQYRELFINKIVTKITQSISEEEVIQKNKMLVGNKIPVDPDFWDKYNYIINEKLMED